MENYDYVTTFFPYGSDKEYKEMQKFLNGLGDDIDWYESQYVGNYYLEFYDPGHERDSSGIRLTIWKKKI